MPTVKACAPAPKEQHPRDMSLGEAQVLIKFKASIDPRLVSFARDRVSDELSRMKWKLEHLKILLHEAGENA